MSRSSSRVLMRVKPRSETRAERLIRTLVLGCRSPAEVLELCYWSREPGMVALMRGIVAMPEEARAAFEAFIALAHDPKSIEARLDRDGVLTFVSPEVPKAIAIARHAAESDGHDPAKMLN